MALLVQMPHTPGQTTHPAKAFYTLSLYIVLLLGKPMALSVPGNAIFQCLHLSGVPYPDTIIIGPSSSGSAEQFNSALKFFSLFSAVGKQELYGFIFCIT